MLNWELLKHPLNWIIVALMLVIAGAAGHLVLTHFGAQASGPNAADDALDAYAPPEANRNEVASAVLAQ